MAKDKEVKTAKAFLQNGQMLKIEYENHESCKEAIFFTKGEYKEQRTVAIVPYNVVVLFE